MKLFGSLHEDLLQRSIDDIIGLVDVVKTIDSTDNSMSSLDIIYIYLK